MRNTPTAQRPHPAGRHVAKTSAIRCCTCHELCAMSFGPSRAGTGALDRRLALPGGVGDTADLGIRVTSGRHDTIERLRSRYLHDYRRIYSKPGRIAFFEDLRRSAETADAPAWARFAAAMSAWLRKELDAALRLASEAITLEPGFAYAWNGRGNVLQSLKRYDEAHADYRRAIALDPACAHPWINLGNLLRRLRRYDEALAAYTTAVSLGPGYVRPWINTGTVLLDMGRSAEALAAYAKATEVDPKYSHPWNCKGNVLLLEGRRAEALQAYDRAIALEPDYPDPWEGKGRALEGLGCHADAAAAFARAAALKEGSA
jgi:tetratricopeptide (TPR) repeat protein